MEIIVGMVLVCLVLILAGALYGAWEERKVERGAAEAALKLSNAAKEQAEANAMYWEKAYNIQLEASAKMEVIRNEKDACVYEIEEQAVADTSGWFSERLPDSVRNIIASAASDSTCSDSEAVSGSSTPGSVGNE